MLNALEIRGLKVHRSYPMILSFIMSPKAIKGRSNVGDGDNMATKRVSFVIQTLVAL